MKESAVCTVFSVFTIEEDSVRAVYDGYAGQCKKLC